MMIWAIFFVILGICIGSFSNVLIYRLPLNESINFPASHCTNCKSPLKWYHNIPLFSWLFLGGKCAFCKDKISIRYPLIETLGGALMFCAFYYETAGVNFANLGENLGFLALFRALILGILFIVLLALSAIDFKYTAIAPSFQPKITPITAAIKISALPIASRPKILLTTKRKNQNTNAKIAPSLSGTKLQDEI